jgi:uncharacterized RDD family membrane protein YckC
MFCSRCGQPGDPNALYCAYCGAPLPRATPYATPGANPPAPAWNYAPWGDRGIGYLIDMVVVIAAVAVVGLVWGLVFGGVWSLFRGVPSGSEGLCCIGLVFLPLAGFLVGLYNRCYLVAERGCSIGQGVMHLRVVDAGGQLITMGRALGRLAMHTVFGFVPLLQLLDLLWPLWDDRRQTLHDKVTGTYVVRA